MAYKSRGSHHASTRSKLCSVCENIDFHRYLLEPIKSNIELGTVYVIVDRAGCPFCDVVAHGLQGVVVGPETLKLANQKSWKLCVIESDYDRWRLRNYSNRRDLILRDHRDAETTHSHAYQLLVVDSRGTLVQVQYLADKEGSKIDRQFFGRRVGEFVNWRLLGSWLSECDRHHTNSCRGNFSNPSRLPNRLRLIDVIDEEIVPANHDDEYVALSYVWGAEAMGRPMVTLTKGMCAGKHRIALPNNLQKTIRDAIAVTRKLGYRYLWNDALCIIQDSKEDVRAQTDRMDAIYNRPRLTIVAVSGNHADSGLPGVTSLRDLCQYSRVVDGLRLATVLARFEHVVSKYRSDLAWNTRARTLQEKVLSNRILVFANWQVYFRCCNAVCCEDIAMETGRLSNSILRNADPFMWPMNRPPGKRSAVMKGLFDLESAFLAPAQSLAFMNGIIRPLDLFNNDLKIYASVVEEYTMRSLTYHSDVLRAISGVLRTFESSLGRFVSGMPVDFLDKALTWRPSPQARSRMARAYAPPGRGRGGSSLVAAAFGTT